MYLREMTKFEVGMVIQVRRYTKGRLRRLSGHTAVVKRLCKNGEAICRFDAPLPVSLRLFPLNDSRANDFRLWPRQCFGIVYPPWYVRTRTLLDSGRELLDDLRRAQRKSEHSGWAEMLPAIKAVSESLEGRLREAILNGIDRPAMERRDRRKQTR